MSPRTKWILLFASSCWMIGEGLRMAVMAVFFHDMGWWYFPNTFDLLFDWVPLVMLGSILFLDSLLQFYRSKSGAKRGPHSSLAYLTLSKVHR